MIAEALRWQTYCWSSVEELSFARQVIFFRNSREKTEQVSIKYKAHCL